MVNRVVGFLTCDFTRGESNFDDKIKLFWQIWKIYELPSTDELTSKGIGADSYLYDKCFLNNMKTKNLTYMIFILHLSLVASY